MISKDVDLIAEAYLSAMQKNHNFAPDPAMDSVAEVNPELTDRENVESPVAMTVSVPAGPEAMGAMDQGSGYGSSMSDQAHEESEEHWMVRSNLFSLYSNAKKIHNLAQTGNIDLEPWAQQKIAVACQSVEDVMKYVAYEAAEKGINS